MQTVKSPEINQFNLNSGLLAKYKFFIYGNSTWHKIEVQNASKLDRDTVLKTIMNFVHPLDFIPVCYEVKGPVVSFLLKNSGAAIERLCCHNLLVANPQDPSMPFKISIILNYAYATDLKINIQNNISSILAKRFNAETGILNLEMFYKDPDLIEFCTLSQPKLMFYVLHLSRSDGRADHVKSIKLSNNEIEVLKPLEALCRLKSLTTLDLRNNNIKEINPSHFRSLPITELWLDGNPICDDYDEFTYPRTMKEVIPTLEKLDGVHIQNNGMFPFRRNFLCTAEGHDLVDQFLEHYFNLYDAQSRTLLEGVYHKNAMLSLTANYLPAQTTSLSAKLTPYKKVARNLKTMSDFSKNDEFLFRGRQSILQVLSSLPASEHDPYTFAVDLMSYTKTAAVLVVNGVFRETGETLLDADRVMGFSRVFVLLAGQNDEYMIVNEQLHVYNATTAQVSRSFRVTKVPQPTHIQIPAPQNVKEQVAMAEALVSITGLNIEWATKCLEEARYDLKRSLELFVDLFKLDKIPANAFRNIPPNEQVQSKKSLSTSLEISASLPASINTISGAPNVPIQDNVPVLEQNYISVFEEEQKNCVKQFAPGNRVMKKDQNRRADFQDLCKNNSTFIKQGETNDVEVESVVTNDCMIQNQDLLPLLPDCEVSPFGIFEKYNLFMFPSLAERMGNKPNTNPENTDFWPTACKLVDFEKKFKKFKKHKQNDTRTTLKSIDLAMDIVRCYSYHIVTYQVLLVFYFARNKPAAVEFCKQVSAYIAENKARCISPDIFSLMVLECKLVTGDAAVAQHELKKIICSCPSLQLDAINVYMRYICGTKKSEMHARNFFQWARNVPNIDKTTFLRIIEEYETRLTPNN